MTVVNTEADAIWIKYFSRLLTSLKDCIPPEKVNVYRLSDVFLFCGNVVSSSIWFFLVWLLQRRGNFLTGVYYKLNSYIEPILELLLHEY